MKHGKKYVEAAKVYDRADSVRSETKQLLS